MVLRILVVAAAVAAGVAALLAARGSAGAADAGPRRALPAAVRSSLHVEGNRLVDGRGRTVLLRGVNRSGSEYACLHGESVFDGPADAGAVAALVSWHVNLVRVPLNEDCWLGINGVPPATSGAAYRAAVLGFVTLLRRAGIYVELSLIWGAPGGYQATYQAGAPDADHAPVAWARIAAAFRDSGGVILAPWGETVVNSACFRDGGTCEATFGPQNTPYRTAGMAEAVRVIRAAGYAGPVAIPGVAFGNDLSGWLAHRPQDPYDQLVAEAHVYGNSTCSSDACLDRTIAPLSRRVPVLLGEVGESYDASDCSARATARIFSWAVRHGAGFAAWAWDTWDSCSALITSYAGTPAGPYGAFVRRALASMPAPLPTPEAP